MDSYAEYVVPAYLISVAVLGLIGIYSVHQYARVKKKLSASGEEI